MPQEADKESAFSTNGTYLSMNRLPASIKTAINNAAKETYRFQSISLSEHLAYSA